MEFSLFAASVIAAIFAGLYVMERAENKYAKKCWADYQNNYYRLVDENKELKEKLDDHKQVIDSIHALSSGYGPEKETKLTATASDMQAVTWKIKG